MNRRMNRYMGRRIDSRQPKSRTPPEWETNESFFGETQELETARKADTISQTWRQMNRYMRDQETNELETAREPDTTSQTGKQSNRFFYGEIIEFETARAGHHQQD